MIIIGTTIHIINTVPEKIIVKSIAPCVFDGSPVLKLTGSGMDGHTVWYGWTDSITATETVIAIADWHLN